MPCFYLPFSRILCLSLSICFVFNQSSHQSINLSMSLNSTVGMITAQPPCNSLLFTRHRPAPQLHPQGPTPTIPCARAALIPVRASSPRRRRRWRWRPLQGRGRARDSAGPGRTERPAHTAWRRGPGDTGSARGTARPCSCGVPGIGRGRRDPANTAQKVKARAQIEESGRAEAHGTSSGWMFPAGSRIGARPRGHTMIRDLRKGDSPGPHQDRIEVKKAQLEFADVTCEAQPLCLCSVQDQVDHQAPAPPTKGA